MSVNELRLRCANPSIAVQPFGQMPSGIRTSCYILRSDALEATIVPYGGRVVSLRVPDRNGVWDEVTLGFDCLEGYIADKSYVGATIGRFANRIAKGAFQLKGESYSVARNDGEQCLHGGEGFEHRIWHAQIENETLGLSYLSLDGEAGFPGELQVRVNFSVVGPEFRIDYEAACDRPTFVNLTNHSYFNLAGADSGRNILGHQLTIAADRYLPTDAVLIPLEGSATVDDSPFDFRRPHSIGARINETHDQLALAGGYDHCWILKPPTSRRLELIARLHDPDSGRVMYVMTTEPGLQFYSGNFLDGRQVGRKKLPYARYAGLCLETQHFPDTPNRADFPSALLQPGEIYRSSTIYRFAVDSHFTRKDVSS